MVEGDYNLEKEVHVPIGQVLVKMHVTDLAAAQREDLHPLQPLLSTP